MSNRIDLTPETVAAALERRCWMAGADSAAPTFVVSVADFDTVSELCRRQREVVHDIDEAIACTECGDDGFTVETTAHGELEQVQCQWCHTVGNSLFQVKARAAVMLALWPDDE